MTALQAVLSEHEARSLTDEVKQDAERLWLKLAELYDGYAHVALGYSSWGSYFEAEFGGSKSHAYRLLDAGRVMQIVSQSPMGERPNERQARELAPLIKEPELVQQAWEEAVESSNGKPTATAVKTAVSKRRMTASDREEILRLRKDGLTGVRIAELTGWSQQAVSKIVSPKKKGALPRRHVAGNDQTRLVAKLQQTCREWKEAGDEEYIPAPEVARRIRLLDEAIKFLTDKRTTYKEVSRNGGRNDGT